MMTALTVGRLLALIAIGVLVVGGTLVDLIKEGRE